MSNIYNLDGIVNRLHKEFRVPEVKPDRMFNWIDTVFRRHMQNCGIFPGLMYVPVITQREEQIMNLKGLKFLAYTLRNSDLEPEWVARCISLGDAVWFVNYSVETVGKLCHLGNFFKKEFSNRTAWLMPVDEAVRGAVEWTRHLNKKIREDVGLVEEVYRGETGDWYVVRLLDEAAYQYEGHHMQHCVASYWGESGSVYSLRTMFGDGKTAAATIEVNDLGYVIQVQGFGNSEVGPDVKMMVETFAGEMKFRWVKTVAILFGESLARTS